MTTINLKDFYPWYMTDEHIEVSDEVAAELRASKLAEAAYAERVRYNKATIPSTVTMGSSIPPVCMSPPRRSWWSAWSVSITCGTPSTPCRRSRAAGWMPISSSARAIGRLLGLKAWIKAPSAILFCVELRP